MQQIQVLSLLVGLGMFLAALFIFIVWIIRQEQQRNRAHFEQLSLLAEVTTQEKDKALITYQLHETFGATLSTVKLYMNSFNLTSAADQEHRKTACQHIDDLMKAIRGVALEYLPYPLQEDNLEDALERYVTVLNGQHNDLVTLELEEELPAIPTHKAISIYRILQEVVENTIRHARASALIITVRHKADGLHIVTQDNGIGFDYAHALEKEKGTGLNTIINRVKLLKGMLEVNSAKGGTMYVIQIPI